MFLCDLCKSEKDVHTFSITYGPPVFNGVDSDKSICAVDLCPACMVKVINKFLNSLPMEERLPALGVKEGR